MMKDRFGREIEIAPQVAIEQYLDLAGEFLKSVFDIKGAFVTDLSSLDDFFDDDSDKEKIFKKVKSIYNVDISDIEDLNLVTILQRIRVLTGK